MKSTSLWRLNDDRCIKSLLGRRKRLVCDNNWDYQNLPYHPDSSMSGNFAACPVLERIEDLRLGERSRKKRVETSIDFAYYFLF